LMRSFQLPRERVYRAVAQKCLWYILPSRCRCMVTVIHSTVWQPKFKHIWHYTWL
jgi:hypothetical protein